MGKNLNGVMVEGMQKTLEAMELMKKQVAGTITPQEETRLAMLNGNLLALAEQAVDLGFDPQAAIDRQRGAVEVADEGDEDLNEDYLGEGLEEYDNYPENDEDEDEGEESVICWCGDPDCR